MSCIVQSVALVVYILLPNRLSLSGIMGRLDVLSGEASFWLVR